MTIFAADKACTLSFLVKNASELGFLTAGHCFESEGMAVAIAKTTAQRREEAETSAEHAAALADCPQLRPPNLLLPTECLNAHIGPALSLLANASDDRFIIGRVVLAHFEDSHGDDYALVELNEPSRPRATPVIPGIGAPCGVAAESAEGALVISHASGTGLASSPRATRLSEFAFEGFTTSGPSLAGDSGAPVLTLAGRLAVGIHTWGAPGVFVEGNGVPFPAIGPVGLKANGGGTSTLRALDALAGWELVPGDDC